MRRLPLVFVLAIVMVARGQEDLIAKIENPRLSRWMRSIPQIEKEDYRRAGPERQTDWRLEFGLSVTTTNARAWPLDVRSALLQEDSRGVRCWHLPSETSGARVPWEYRPVEVYASHVAGSEKREALYKRIGNVVAWKIVVLKRVPGRVDLERVVACEALWVKPGIAGDVGLPYGWEHYYPKRRR